MLYDLAHRYRSFKGGIRVRPPEALGSEYVVRCWSPDDREDDVAFDV